jgi:predicted Fe-S protein YdhL (DUF1289 family)
MNDLYLTPCIGICKVEKDTKICTGCKRTLEEIQEWRLYSYEEKMNIMRRLGYAKRRAKNEN